MTDTPETPDEPKKNKGWFTKNDPRRSTGSKPRRTKDGKSLTSLARDYTEEGLQLLVDLMRDPNQPSKVRVDCVKELFSRGWGNAHQQISIDAQVSHTQTTTIDWNLVPVELKKQLLIARHASLVSEHDVIDVTPVIKGDDEL